MMVGVAQMLNSAMIASLGGYKHLDADTQARMVLDRMAFDIAKMSRRADVDYYFAKNVDGATPGNDQMAFYSESGGYYPSGVSAATQGSEVSLVGYRINANNQLERLSKGLIWNGVSNTAPPMVYGVSATPGAVDRRHLAERRGQRQRSRLPGHRRPDLPPRVLLPGHAVQLRLALRHGAVGHAARDAADDHVALPDRRALRHAGHRAQRHAGRRRRGRFHRGARFAEPDHREAG